MMEKSEALQIVRQVVSTVESSQVAKALMVAAKALEREIEEEEVELRKAAIEHYEYGIDHDLFREPVATYARMAVAALKQQNEKTEGAKA